MKYRKKPVVIDAYPAREVYRCATSDWKGLPDCIVKAYEVGDVLFLNHPPRMEIRTREGIHTADIDDMIIRGAKGELYPCKPDIFAATYDAESDDES